MNTRLDEQGEAKRETTQSSVTFRGGQNRIDRWWLLQDVNSLIRDHWGYSNDTSLRETEVKTPTFDFIR